MPSNIHHQAALTIAWQWAYQIFLTRGKQLFISLVVGSGEKSLGRNIGVQPYQSLVFGEGTESTMDWCMAFSIRLGMLWGQFCSE